MGFDLPTALGVRRPYALCHRHRLLQPRRVRTGGGTRAAARGCRAASGPSSCPSPPSLPPGTVVEERPCPATRSRAAHIGVIRAEIVNIHLGEIDGPRMGHARRVPGGAPGRRRGQHPSSIAVAGPGAAAATVAGRASSPRSRSRLPVAGPARVPFPARAAAIRW